MDSKERVEEILKGYFKIQPQLLIVHEKGLGRIYDFPYSEKGGEFEVKIEKWKNILIINSSEGAKILFKCSSSLKICNLETQEVNEINHGIPFKFSYNSKRNHILVFYDDFKTGKSHLTAYNFEGEKVYEKPFDMVGKFYTFDDYLALVNSKSFQLIDILTYESVRSVKFPSFQEYEVPGISVSYSAFLSAIPWISRNRILIKYCPHTLVYDILEEKVVEVIKHTISKVVNSNYGVAGNFDEKMRCHYKSLIKLDIPTHENIAVPRLCSFWSEGRRGNEILLALGKRVFVLNLENQIETEILSSERKVDYAIFLPGRKGDKKILFQVFKKRLEDHLPVDLIKLTFEQIIE
jgi:hypothetical protein